MSLVNRNEDLRQNYVRQVIARITRHGAFQFFILMCVLADAVIQSFFNRYAFAKYVQIGFTLLFLLETILKVRGGVLHWSIQPYEPDLLFSNSFTFQTVATEAYGIFRVFDENMFSSCRSSLQILAISYRSKEHGSLRRY